MFGNGNVKLQLGDVFFSCESVHKNSVNTIEAKNKKIDTFYNCHKINIYRYLYTLGDI